MSHSDKDSNAPTQNSDSAIENLFCHWSDGFVTDDLTIDSTMKTFEIDQGKYEEFLQKAQFTTRIVISISSIISFLPRIVNYVSGTYKFAIGMTMSISRTFNIVHKSINSVSGLSMFTIKIAMSVSDATNVGLMCSCPITHVLLEQTLEY